jgi:hypothetical protein
MKNRDCIITEIFHSSELKQVINKMNPAHLRDELLSEVMLVICQLPEERLIQMYEDGYLKYYVVRTILNMMQSDKSSFFFKFRNSPVEFNNEIDVVDEGFDIKREAKFDKVEKFHKSLPFYENKLLEYYTEYNNKATKLARETHIPVRSIYHTIKQIKKKARQMENTNTIKFNIECQIELPNDYDVDEIMNELDKIWKMIEDIKNKKFEPICYRIL